MDQGWEANVSVRPHVGNERPGLAAHIDRVVCRLHFYAELSSRRNYLLVVCGGCHRRHAVGLHRLGKRLGRRSSSIGSLLGITSLYLYYFVFPWSGIEFLNLLDTLKAKHPGGNPLLYMFLIKDIAGGFLGNLRNMALMWLLASTGFYEPDCNAQCETSTAAECVAQCHAEAHASITAGTVTLVRVLYVGVTPGAYILACMMIRMYSALEPHDFHKKQSSSDLG
mmetsp:Transcript_97264/g.313553  ORF Transcript_97264/g.313553 Transcript_97264/m.313553 type:complete len:224 (-) Transcript_97264:780-1451(-)